MLLRDQTPALSLIMLQMRRRSTPGVRMLSRSFTNPCNYMLQQMEVFPPAFSMSEITQQKVDAEDHGLTGNPQSQRHVIQYSETQMEFEKDTCPFLKWMSQPCFDFRHAISLTFICQIYSMTPAFLKVNFSRVGTGFNLV